MVNDTKTHASPRIFIINKHVPRRKPFLKKAHRVEQTSTIIYI